jgi:peptidoglycan/LPS O-acetylase OafA/YrhL
MKFRFSQPSTLGRAIESHDNGFNFVRLVCALLVVVYHSWGMNPVHPGPDVVTRFVTPHGDLGSLAVGVFFMISGIFVTQSWARDPHLFRFALRRIARILPGLFACLLVTTIVAVGFFSEQGWAGLLQGATWRYVFGNTVLHWLHYIIRPEELHIAGVLGGQHLNGPLWTLYWEGRMYVMVALIGLSAALPLRTWLRGMALFLLLAANLFPEVAAGYIWEVRLWSLFLTGMLLYTLAPDLRVGWIHVACAIAFAAMNFTRWSDINGSGLTWFGIVLVAATLGLAVGSAPMRRFSYVQRHDYSYGVYIYHWPVLLMLRAALPPMGAKTMVLAALLVTLPLAMLSWHLVEAPAMRAARRWLRRTATPAPTPATSERESA